MIRLDHYFVLLNRSPECAGMSKGIIFLPCWTRLRGCLFIHENDEVYAATLYDRFDSLYYSTISTEHA